MDALTLLADVMQRPVPKADDDCPLIDLPGWDSIMMVRLLLKMEETLGRELSPDEIEAIAKVGDLRKILSAGVT